MLCILDGWGLSPDTKANAVFLGRTPNFDRIWQTCPHTQLVAHGSDVGLPAGVMGNSEVGHLNIGAGRIVYQDSLLIDNAVVDGSFFENEVLLEAISRVQQSGTRLHLMGLTSSGNVHASQGHYVALLEMAARHGLLGDRVVFHAFTDGRDTAPHSSYGFIANLLEQMMHSGAGCIGSIVGRYYAMDRDQRWPRVKLAYELLTEGIGHRAPNAIAAITAAYARGETDEFIGATVVLDEQGNPRPRIVDGDAVLFFNYRSDRGRELMQVFLDPSFDGNLAEAPADADRARFRRQKRPDVYFASMTRYSEGQTAPYAFGPRPQRDGLGETLAKAGKTQLRMAETEKYPHVTFFFSGGLETPWKGEDRILVSSPKVATYDLQPEMSAPEVSEKIDAAILSQKYDFIVLNFANPDMVGHTGSLAAAITAVETVDGALGEVLDAIDRVGGNVVVIADHGNCEMMIDPETGGPHTAHTTNPVPCVLYGPGTTGQTLRSGGRISDVAPTLLQLMGVPQPAAMTGVSLLGSSDEPALAARTATPKTTLAGAVLRAQGEPVNDALSEVEVLAGLAQQELRLAQACEKVVAEGNFSELASALASSARARASLLGAPGPNAFQDHTQ